MVFGMSGEYFKVFILLGRYATFDVWLFTEVWGQSIGPIFKVQAAFFIIDCLNLKYGTNILSRNVGNNHQPTLSNNPEERRLQLILICT